MASGRADIAGMGGGKGASRPELPAKASPAELGMDGRRAAQMATGREGIPVMSAGAGASLPDLWSYARGGATVGVLIDGAGSLSLDLRLQAAGPAEVAARCTKRRVPK